MSRIARRIAPRTKDGPPRPVEVVRPDPLAWSIAIDLANGDARRCRAIAPRVVMVFNVADPARQPHVEAGQ